MNVGSLIRRLVLFQFAILCPCIHLVAETVTLTQDSIHRLVYSSHLLTLIDENPELEAALQALLELDRRNPEASSDEIVQVLQVTLQTYREANPTGTGYKAPPDVVLTSFYWHLIQTPGYYDLRPVTLEMLKRIIDDTYKATQEPSARPHSGNQEVLSLEHALENCQDFLEEVVIRTDKSSRFGRMVDSLLDEETEVSIHHPPWRILELNTALGASPTMQWLASTYDNATSGSVEVDTGQLESLYTAEMEILRGTIESNRSMIKEMEREQVEMASYLSDSDQVAADQLQQNQARGGNSERISSSTAAAQALSFTVREVKPNMSKHMKTVANSMSSIARGLNNMKTASKFSKLAGCTDFVSAGLTIVSMFMDTVPSPEEMILEEIGKLKQMIHDLAEHIDYRFDRVDDMLNVVMDQLDYSIQLIGETGHDVDEVRLDLLDVQAGLARLERELYNYLNAGFRRPFVERVNGDLQYEVRTGDPMPWTWYRDTSENTFYSWAVSHSKDELSSYWPAQEDLTDSVLLTQLNSRPLESNLNYIKEFLNQRLGVPQLSAKPLASPRDWFAGADAYLKLAVENPLHYRRMNRLRLDDVIDVGEDLEDFLRSLSLDSENHVNYFLWNSLLTYYGDRLDDFEAAVAQEESEQAELGEVSHTMWRDWDLQCEDQLVDDVEINGYMKIVRIPTDVIQMDCGQSHVLVLKSNGTVIAFGYAWAGNCDVPAGLVNVVAVSGGSTHSLALLEDGTVVVWGSNNWGQCNIPEGLDDVVAISAGPHHNLALRSDGTVVTWGYLSDNYGAVPEGLSDVTAISAGGDSNRDIGVHNLAVKSDGSVVAWGNNSLGQCDVPVALANGDLDVVHISAGPGRSAAVLADGSIIGWPDPFVASKPAAAIDLSYDYENALVLCQDGTIEILGGSDGGVPVTDDIIAVAQGGNMALALHENGTLTGWGSSRYFINVIDQDQAIASMASTRYHLLLLMDDGSIKAVKTYAYEVSGPPEGTGPFVAVAAGRRSSEIFSLGLTTQGTVVAWGGNSVGQCDVPEGLSDVVAISASEGTYGGTSMALRRDGTVVVWGDNGFLQRNMPGGLNNVVDIAAGERQCAALNADGTVVAWGINHYGQLNIPAGLDNVVDIDSRYCHIMALKADGTVVAWGLNDYGQCDVPEDLDDVVTIEAGYTHSLAVKSDGSVVGWGYNHSGGLDYASSMTGVLQVAYGGSVDHYLCPAVYPSDDLGELTPYCIRTRPSQAVTQHFVSLFNKVLNEFEFDLNDSANAMTGAKALLRAVVSLALPVSLDNDDALRGFLLGSESIPDYDVARDIYAAEIYRLETDPWVRPAALDLILRDRFMVFQTRLFNALEAEAYYGKPEIARLVSHTLTQLRILQFAHRSGETPTPVFDLYEENPVAGGISGTLYGEPYIHYPLDKTADLNFWPPIDLTIENQEVLNFQTGGPEKSWFYRVTVPESQ